MDEISKENSGSPDSNKLASGEFRWSARLDNLAFPLDQPRHVPVLVANDVVQPQRRQIATGRLTCFDKRTGNPLVSLSASLHMYYALEADLSRGEIALRMKQRTIRLNYHDAEDIQ